MSTPRESPAMVRLGDGSVLVAGGIATATLSSAEIFDPAQRTRTTVASLPHPMQSSVGIGLPDGSALIAGGFDGGSTEGGGYRYFPGSNAWGNMWLNVYRYSHTLERFPDDTVMVLGGRSSQYSAPGTFLYDYEPGTRFNPLPQGPELLESRYEHASVSLPSGVVVAFGRFNADLAEVVSTTATVERLILSEVNRVELNPLPEVRASHRATALRDGRVLITGGTKPATDPNRNRLVHESCILYDVGTDPGCLGDGDCPSGHPCVDGVCCDSACTGACQACSAFAKGEGTNGACGTVVAGRDPDRECAAMNASTCETTGACAGDAPACAVWPVDTVCGPSQCDANGWELEAKCVGFGCCEHGAVLTCSEPCAAEACATTCVPDVGRDAGWRCGTDCAPGGDPLPGSCAAGGAGTGGAETGGVETGGAGTGRAGTGGAETGGVETGGVETAGTRAAAGTAGTAGPQAGGPSTGGSTSSEGVDDHGGAGVGGRSGDSTTGGDETGGQAAVGGAARSAGTTAHQAGAPSVSSGGTTSGGAPGSGGLSAGGTGALGATSGTAGQGAAGAATGGSAGATATGGQAAAGASAAGSSVAGAGGGGGLAGAAGTNARRHGSGDHRGCGCRTAEGSPSRAALIGAFVMALAVFLRRRRTGPSSITFRSAAAR
ncbi:MAG: MYXO-CTERM sorting domain-containing protein [Polyangiaceae bacterium]|nr:MYXO-CTERM sorting domain-containing protein [Polyangiaceae bacterium]